MRLRSAWSEPKAMKARAHLVCGAPHRFLHHAGCLIAGS